MTTQTTPTPKTMADLTLAELVALLRATVTESLAEIVGYPDEQPEPCQGAASATEPSAQTDATALSPTMARKVSDLPVDEFQWWIHYIVGEVGEDLIGDPDEGLEFTEEFEASILEASASAAAGNTIPAEEVHRRLGLD